MSASLTCDNCGKTQTITRSWLTVSSSGDHSITIGSKEPIKGDYCSAKCLAARAAGYADRVAGYAASLPWNQAS